MSAADWNALQKRLTKKRKNARPEAKALKSCLQWLKTHHIPAWRSNTGAYEVKDDLGNSRFIAYGAVGSPDIHGIIPGSGKYLGIEVKASGKKLKPEQQAWRDMVVIAGGVYILAYSTDDLQEKLLPLL